MAEMIKREYYDAMKHKADRFEAMWRQEHAENTKLRKALGMIAEAMEPFINPEVVKFLNGKMREECGRHAEKYDPWKFKGVYNGEHDDVIQSNDCETDAEDLARIDAEKPEESWK